MPEREYVEEILPKLSSIRDSAVAESVCFKNIRILASSKYSTSTDEKTIHQVKSALNKYFRQAQKAAIHIMEIDKLLQSNPDNSKGELLLILNSLPAKLAAQLFQMDKFKDLQIVPDTIAREFSTQEPDSIIILLSNYEASPSEAIRKILVKKLPKLEKMCTSLTLSLDYFMNDVLKTHSNYINSSVRKLFTLTIDLDIHLATKKIPSKDAIIAFDANFLKDYDLDALAQKKPYNIISNMRQVQIPRKVWEEMRRGTDANIHSPLVTRGLLSYLADIKGYRQVEINPPVSKEEEDRVTELWRIHGPKDKPEWKFRHGADVEILVMAWRRGILPTVIFSSDNDIIKVAPYLSDMATSKIKKHAVNVYVEPYRSVPKS